MKSDLHCHSNYSDGSCSMRRLFRLAQAGGLNTLAVTDHDTVAGLPEAREMAQQFGINLVEGLELSGRDPNTKRRVHLLCYWPKTLDPILEVCATTVKQRKTAGEEMTCRVAKRYPLLLELVQEYAQNSYCIFRQHIMHALIDAGYALTIYDPLYQELFGKGPESCFVPVRYPDIYRLLEAVHASGGLAVLAHPRAYESFELMDKLLEQGQLQGIEAWHPSNRPGDADYLLAKAKQYRLLATGGSDFHGMYNARPNYLGKCKTPQEESERLLAAGK